MGERVLPYRSKPSETVLALIRDASSRSFFLVQRPGPTSFVIREGTGEEKHRVLVGSRQSCSCGGGAGKHGAGGGEICVHIVFVMVKVLGVPACNPLVWQLSLIDKEIDEALKCRPNMVAPLSTGGGAKGESGSASPSSGKQHLRRRGRGGGEVERRSLDGDATCPICYEDMAGASLAALVFCRTGCGNNVHGRCMRVWAEHQTSIDKPLTCPMCRADWGAFDWVAPKESRASSLRRPQGANPCHHGVLCGSCHVSPIVGPRFRCLVCQSMDLCRACFEAGAHPEHPFANRATPMAAEEMADRPPGTPLRRNRDSNAAQEQEVDVAREANLIGDELALRGREEQRREHSGPSGQEGSEHRRQESTGTGVNSRAPSARSHTSSRERSGGFPAGPSGRRRRGLPLTIKSASPQQSCSGGSQELQDLCVDGLSLHSNSAQHPESSRVGLSRSTPPAGTSSLPRRGTTSPFSPGAGFAASHASPRDADCVSAPGASARTSGDPKPPGPKHQDHGSMDSSRRRLRRGQICHPVPLVRLDIQGTSRGSQGCLASQERRSADGAAGENIEAAKDGAVNFARDEVRRHSLGHRRNGSLGRRSCRSSEAKKAAGIQGQENGDGADMGMGLVGTALDNGSIHSRSSMMKENVVQSVHHVSTL